MTDKTDRQDRPTDRPTDKTNDDQQYRTNKERPSHDDKVRKTTEEVKRFERNFMELKQKMMMKGKEEFERRNKLMIIRTYGACEIPNNLNIYFENTRIEKLKRKKVTETLLMMVNSFSYYDSSTECIYSDLTSKKTEEMTMSEWIKDYVWRYLKYKMVASGIVCL